MKLSHKRRTALYGVIHNGIVDLRIALGREYKLPAHVDVLIAQTGEQIARDVLRVVKAGKAGR